MVKRGDDVTAAQEQPGEAPSVSIIIPCLNEQEHIGPCLDSLLATDLPRDRLEIFVVDGMSTDRTRKIVAEYSERHPFIQLLDNPKKIKPIALNLGIEASNSDVVIRIDAHSSYAPDYLSKLVDGLFALGADNIGGIRETKHGDSLLSIAAAEAVSHRFAAGDALYRTAGERFQEPIEVDTVFCGSYRREVFAKIGLFNEDLIRTQDREFNLRLREAGGKILLDPSIRCSYVPRTSPLTFAKWNYEGGFWVFYANRFTDTPMFARRNYVPVVFVLWHVATAGLLVVVPPAGVLATLPIGAYWGLNLYFSARIALKHRRPGLMVVMPWFFAGTHYPYGIGSLVGRARYLLQGKKRRS